ncbi:MAG: macro domain-containing protein [Candidatus Aminicenantaceae bacterium]
MMEKAISDHKLRLIEGNLALVEADAVVNAANKSLILGGGVAGAIRNLGGPTIQEQCNRIGPIDAGGAVITGGGDLKARYVIHAVGPVYGEGDEDLKLERATRNSLKLAEKHKLNSIAFPAISTGIFHFPIRRCSDIMLRTAIQFLGSNQLPSEVIFCLYENDAYEVFAETLDRLTTSNRIQD